jgi:signal peptidase II
MKRQAWLARARRVLPKVALAGLVVSMVGCDHATKHAAARHLSARPPVELLPGWLDLRYAENRDTAFSLMDRFGLDRAPRALGLLAATVLVVLAVLWWQRRHQLRALEHVGFALATAGALGNVIDRIARGYVIDFIHVRAWPIFNVADVLVVVGGGLLLIANAGSKNRGSGVGSSVPWTRAF